MIRLLSWNVNGLRSVLGKDFMVKLKAERPDVLCLQETRVREEQLPKGFLEELAELGYSFHLNPAERPGYSGTATLCLTPPMEIHSGFAALDAALAEWDNEGRVTVSRHALGKSSFLLFNIYFPNGTSGEERLHYKMNFYEAFQRLVEDLVTRGESVVVCGDLNTSHREIDLARPAANRKNSGFLPEECAWIDRFLSGTHTTGMIDSFRHLHPDAADRYSWWSNRGGARAKNVGWRLDYFFASRDLEPRLQKADILDQITGSDHCPVELVLK